jgi:hypothetical protein
VLTWRLLLCAALSMAAISCATPRDESRPAALVLTPCRVTVAQVARSLSNSRHLVVPNAGHAYGHPCLDGIVAEFFANGSAHDLDVACVQTLQRPPFVLDLR